MSAPILRSRQQEQKKFQGKPAWLTLFLRTTFLGGCATHNLNKNELNKYCISCGLALCDYCVASGSHNEHDILKLYRHCKKDVVRIDEMANYIDCSEIQLHESDNLMVLLLKPLLRRSLGAQAANAESACICKRVLNQPSFYRYCSLKCKVKAFSKKENNSDPPFLEIATVNHPPANAEVRGTAPAEARGSKRKRSRKGIPHRAPFS